MGGRQTSRVCDSSTAIDRRVSDVDAEIAGVRLLISLLRFDYLVSTRPSPHSFSSRPEAHVQSLAPVESGAASDRTL